MTFDNDCGCIVDYKILEKAIIFECQLRGITPKNHYKIYNYRNYAGISLKHEKVNVHRIIGQYMVGFKLHKKLFVHHIDGNKMNNSLSNLQVIRNELHTKEHYIVQYVNKEHLSSFGSRMKNVISRIDVTKEKVIELREKGLTISQIAKELNCGVNTVNRRLGMKDY